MGKRERERERKRKREKGSKTIVKRILFYENEIEKVRVPICIPTKDPEMMEIFSYQFLPEKTRSEVL